MYKLKWFWPLEVELWVHNLTYILPKIQRDQKFDRRSFYTRQEYLSSDNTVGAWGENALKNPNISVLLDL